MKRLTALAFAGVLLLAGCGGEKIDKLSGAGATFPAPLYSKMFEEYYNSTAIQIDYEAIGSGGGIQALKDKTVDFGATDKPMSADDISQAGADIVHIPTCVGAVVVTYNIPGDPVLQMTPAVIADIFLGKIKNWNDPAIAAINPGISLPDLTITVVHRSDGSGTTWNFTDYLTKISPEWSSKVGAGKTVVWPTGVGQQGNASVIGYVKANAGAISYVELAYAKQNNLPSATIQNRSGNFIAPTIASITESANIDMPADTCVSLVDTAAPNGYPISTFTWLIIYKEQNYDGRSMARAKAVIKLLKWMTHDAQNLNETLDYAPLPDAAVNKVDALLGSIMFDGAAIR